jgi:GNAT superfamily N-acetyltransferase
VGEPRLVVDEQPGERDVREAEERLNAFNIAATGFDDYQPLAVFMRDDQNGLAGGLTGFTWGGCLKIAILWVKEDWRGHNFGTRMLEAAERIGRERGCQRAVLDSHSFQAPRFYERRGYALCGVADGYSSGHTLYFFEKRLQ